MIRDWIQPDFQDCNGVGSVMTTRAGGVSLGEYGSMNLGRSSGDDLGYVARNREALEWVVGKSVRFVHQVHGTRVVDDEDFVEGVQADAQVTRRDGQAIAVMIADCMPVLFAARDGHVIAAAHAGWRGLSAGVLENTVQAMGVSVSQVVAWMGPCIGPTAFEVGEDVRAAFCDVDASAQSAFASRHGHAGKYWCDLRALARRKLVGLGVSRVGSHDGCTYTEPEQFFSYRRVQKSGRMAALIWKAL